MYYVDLSDRQELEEFLRTHNPTLRTFELRPLAEILDDLRLEDEVAATVLPPVTAGQPWQVRLDYYHSDRLTQRIAGFNHKRAAVKPEAAAADAEVAEAADPATAMPPAPKASATFTPIRLFDEGLELIELVAVDCTTSADPTAPWHSDAELLIDKKSFVRRDGRRTTNRWDGTIGSAQRPLRLNVRNIAGDETVVALPVA